MNTETAMFGQLQAIAEDLTSRAGEYTGLLGSAREMILQHFGQNGLIATYIVLAVLLVFVMSRLVKLTFSAVKYLVLPALVLALIGSMVLPYSFVALLPVTAAGCSLLLLFKG